MYQFILQLVRNPHAINTKTRTGLAAGTWLNGGRKDLRQLFQRLTYREFSFR